MNKAELKLKVLRMSKSYKRNEVYDYIIAKFLTCDRPLMGYITVTEIQNVTGLKIKDVPMMNKLLYYWCNILSDEERILKLTNIIMLIDFESPEVKERYEMLKKADEIESEKIVNKFNKRA